MPVSNPERNLTFYEENFAWALLMVGLFALAFGATLLVALLTMGYKSLRTASLNPAETLKSE